ncbi:dephospho-CoA kinase [Sphingobacterium sp. Mn56C]|uniref:dephospho-CoA kinase n=1 Tax=Sphingobacterium sp. Mn56C TaxID=3395261 RepID=UPI003BD94A9D
MSLKVGITGGIGSGKSFVSKIFKTMAVPFYDADWEAKQIMVTNASVREALIAHFGPEVYFNDGSLNRRLLSETVFNHADKLRLINSIVHPVVIQEAVAWADKQTAAYSLKEAALLFETGSYKTLDYTILVTAPEELRIQRVIERDTVSREEVINRIQKQLPDAEKIAKADFVIVNDQHSPLLPQIINIHQKLVHI